MNNLYLQYKNQETLDETKINQLVQLGKDIDEDVLGQLLKIHLDTSLGIIADMHKLFLSHNYSELKKSAHKFKSSCGNLGLVKLHKICQDLESLLSNSLSQQDVIVVQDFLSCIDYEFNFSQQKLLSYSKAA